MCHPSCQDPDGHKWKAKWQNWKAVMAFTEPFCFHIPVESAKLWGASPRKTQAAQGRDTELVTGTSPGYPLSLVCPLLSLLLLFLLLWKLYPCDVTTFWFANQENNTGVYRLNNLICPWATSSRSLFHWAPCAFLWCFFLGDFVCMRIYAPM